MRNDGIRTEQGILNLIRKERQRNVDLRIVGREDRFDVYNAHCMNDGIIHKEQTVIPLQVSAREDCGKIHRCGKKENRPEHHEKSIAFTLPRTST